MFGTRWRLVRLLGIPISVDASWLIILALLTLSLANVFPSLLTRYYPGLVAQPSQGLFWLVGLLAACAFFVCILLHELGHAVVARSQSMPIRGITLFLFGGVAEIGDEPPSARAEFLMAVAGPVVSAVLTVLLGLLAGLGFQRDWPPLLVIVIGYLAAINLMVLVFNLIPAFPLDGGRVLRSILWATMGNLRRATRMASLIGRGFAYFLMMWGVLEFFGGDWLGGIWIGLIGMFLNNAAQSGYVQVLLRQALQGEPVRRFMNSTPITVPAETDLRQWVEDYVYRYHRKTFPVVSDGRLEGSIDTRALERVPRHEWHLHRVSELTRRDLSTAAVSPDTDALEALRRMQQSGLSRLLVIENGQLVGIISLKDLLRFLNLKLELEGEGESEGASEEMDPGAPLDERKEIDTDQFAERR